ncbi:MAG TPA: class IV adenylate cyclase [Planctomycetota bacterium]|nr:class IV adenylate cyclase [Planctomycetota bacterium]
MQNIEIKAPLIDRANVERRLEAMGAKRMWTRRQHDTFYKVPRGWLKLRETDGARPELISYLRSTSESGPRESDFDVIPVGEPEDWKRLLGRVLAIDAVIEKERTLWIYEHTRIHLDRVRDLGDYLELETIVADIDHDEAIAENRRVIYALALDPSTFVPLPYRDLLR